MPLTVNCQCGTKIEAPDDGSATRVNCPNCGAVIFLMGLSETGDVPDTYGIAGGEEFEPADVAPPPPLEPDSSSTVRPPGWFDRYKASPESRKGERAKMVEVIVKVGGAATVNDPFAAALYRAATRPDADTAIAEVAKIATSGHPVYAPIAIAFLEHVGPSEAKAASAVLRMLQDSRDPQAQLILVQCLQKIGPTPVVHVRDLISALSSPHSSIYIWAAQCLALIGPAAKKAGDVLFKTLKITQQDLRLAVIDALGAIARDPERVVPLLLQALKHQNPEFRRRGATALSRFGPAAAPGLGMLNAALKDEVPAVREAATEALKALTPPPPASVPVEGAPPAMPPALPESIIVPCACGKKLRVKSELGGRRVKCPACGGAVAVPLATPIPDEKDCPGCLATVPNAAVLCVHCGLDFRTGKQFATVADAPAVGGGGAPPLVTL
jgi:HEAT repeat protein